VPRSLSVLFPTNVSARHPRRVVITGGGIITALGESWAENADNFRVGSAAFAPVTLFDVSRQRAKIAAEARLPEEMPACALSPRRWKRLDRAARFLVHAASEAWRQANWPRHCHAPIVLGTTSGGMSLGQEYYRTAIGTHPGRKAQPSRVTNYQCQRQPLDLVDALEFTGPITIIANACASGANAVGHAWELVRAGLADRVLTGGYDALSQLVFSGFDSLQALSTTTCRPFDAARDGLGLGEGATVLALESLESAQSRGAAILAEIAGYGAATDAHHLTQPHPQGDAALQSMTEATRVAEITPEHVGYINAHGTGTPLNDGAEANAINRWAGDHVSRIQVSSTKGSVGHLLGAAGALELAICAMALREQWLPPSPMLRTADPLCRFPLVTQPVDAHLEYALTNSFGFGGANATVILRRAQ
jgi:3-oxoacyl-[acyl-carrier-protein] synthase II